MAQEYRRLRKAVVRLKRKASLSGPAAGKGYLAEAVKLDGKAYAIIESLRVAGWEFIESSGGISWRKIRP